MPLRGRGDYKDPGPSSTPRFFFFWAGSGLILMKTPGSNCLVAGHAGIPLKVLGVKNAYIQTSNFVCMNLS